jgi:hypothetical protein
MVEAGKRKLGVAPRDLLIRGMLSGAILGVATSLALTGAAQTNTPLVGTLIFPVGLIAIVLLGLELVTGSFALVLLPWLNRETSASAVLVNWGWVFIGNLIGSVAYGRLCPSFAPACSGAPEHHAVCLASARCVPVWSGAAARKSSSFCRRLVIRGGAAYSTTAAGLSCIPPASCALHKMRAFDLNSRRANDQELMMSVAAVLSAA